MKIRPIKTEDNRLMKELIQGSLEQLGLDVEGTAYYDPHLADLTSFYEQQPNGKYWVIEDNNQIVAGIGIGELKVSNTCELQKLYIRKEYQGMGLSKKLMDVALDYAMKRYNDCYLETHTDLSSACRLYEKYGFERLYEPLFTTEHSVMNAWYLKNLS